MLAIAQLVLLAMSRPIQLAQWVATQAMLAVHMDRMQHRTQVDTRRMDLRLTNVWMA